jgi:hypothetical protein
MICVVHFYPLLPVRLMSPVYAYVLSISIANFIISLEVLDLTALNEWLQLDWYNQLNICTSDNGQVDNHSLEVPVDAGHAWLSM